MGTKSGNFWITWANQNAQNSSSIDTLEPIFRINATNFINALRNAGATVNVQSTKRDPKRAYLFHWAWRICFDKTVNLSAIPSMQGVEIDWDHGDKDKNYKESIQGAGEMVTGFGLAVPPKSTVAPSLTSNHLIGKAIDMEISWNHKIKVKKPDGKELEVFFPSNPNTNENLIAVGKSYGVFKLRIDRPHWSFNGR